MRYVQTYYFGSLSAATEYQSQPDVLRRRYKKMMEQGGLVGIAALHDPDFADD